MKKLVSFLLCAVMVTCTLASCGKEKLDPGTELNLYMEMPTNFDPATAYTDQAAAQFLPLIYQGLFTVDEKGKLRKSMCDDYTVKDNVIEFTLNETCWSDGTSVTANDYVYAWKRILDPEFQTEAASLLFYIDNAVEVKNGDETVDNLGLYASGDSIVRVELIDASYVDQFLYNCASVALYPLKEDAVSKLNLSQLYYENRNQYGQLITDDVEDKTPVLSHNDRLTDYSWSTLSTILVSCGPFFVKRTNYYPDMGSGSLVLERNKYYYRDTSETSDDALRKSVEPYRLNIEFVSSADAYAAYQSGSGNSLNDALPISYNNNLPLESRSTGDSVHDLLSTYTYYFNTENPTFANADVRRALSGVLDRSEIVKIAVYGKAATGLVNDRVFYTDSKTTYRSKAGDLIGSVMSQSDAKSLISNSGVTPGAITLTVRNNEAEIAVAEYVKKCWDALGFNVTVEPLGYSSDYYLQVVGLKSDKKTYDAQKVYEGLTRDLYMEKYQSGSFDVIGVQCSMMATDPFSVLSSFAPRYSGNKYEFKNDGTESVQVKHVTGYDSSEYNELIDQCMTTFDASERAEILIKAEKLLLEDAVVAPLYFMQSGSVSSDRLEGVSYRYDGIADFRKATDSAYEYVPVVCILPSKIWD